MSSSIYFVVYPPHFSRVDQEVDRSRSREGVSRVGSVGSIRVDAFDDGLFVPRHFELPFSSINYTSDHFLFGRIQYLSSNLEGFKVTIGFSNTKGFRSFIISPRWFSLGLEIKFALQFELRICDCYDSLVTNATNKIGSNESNMR